MRGVLPTQCMHACTRTYIHIAHVCRHGRGAAGMAFSQSPRLCHDRAAMPPAAHQIYAVQYTACGSASTTHRAVTPSCMASLASRRDDIHTYIHTLRPVCPVRLLAVIHPSTIPIPSHPIGHGPSRAPAQHPRACAATQHQHNPRHGAHAQQSPVLQSSLSPRHPSPLPSHPMLCCPRRPPHVSTRCTRGPVIGRRRASQADLRRPPRLLHARWEACFVRASRQAGSSSTCDL